MCIMVRAGSPDTHVCTHRRKHTEASSLLDDETWSKGEIEKNGRERSRKEKRRAREREEKGKGERISSKTHGYR